jgi:hypothetical protein
MHVEPMKPMKLYGILVFFETEIGLFAVALNLRETQIRNFKKNTFKDPGARICKFIIDLAYFSYRPARRNGFLGIDSWTP